ncbi:CotH protein [Pirellulimonas nuda]|uniref:CotH protein n=1 Tax=Pirellulimonas nuda TaxID=2528009 RepID=A0A518DCH5_9BACT|nr:lamin tail domain-containing protein [Pirellulimonas nuda]QDU89160.1 CotH protein [Pirellulimonas nuda]
MLSFRRRRPARASNAATRRRRRAPVFETLESRRVMAVVLAEFLADNESGIRDADGQRQDWVELANTGAAAVDLGGYYLSDDATQPDKWRVPDGVSIAAGQRLVVFASGKDRTNGELHTNFQLEKSGEDLLLVAPDGATVVDAYLSYPPQRADASYGRGVAETGAMPQTLVGAATAVRAHVPTGENAAVDDHWREPGFDDSGWLAGTRSVGFDRNSDGVNLAPFIGRTLTPAEMSTTQTTAYVRFNFEVEGAARLTSLALDLRFDDGFIAYLNGREVARANFAEDFARPQPQWDSFAGNQVGTSSTAGAANRLAEALDVASFELSAYLPLLVEGTNVLAFHAVNSTSSSSSNANRLDLLVEPVLTAGRATGAEAVGFMAWPSPGSPNGVANQGFVGDTHFSVDRGFFDAPFDVAITSQTPGALIRYTTDGSLPSPTTGTLYGGPVAIADTTTLRAIAYKAGYTPTDVDTQTYLFLDDVLQQSAADVTQPYATWGHDKSDSGSESGYNLDDESDWGLDPDIVTGNQQSIKDALQAIPTVSLVMDWDDLFGGTPQPGTFAGTTTVAPQPQGIYIHGSSSERSASLEYFNPASPTDTFHLDVGVETQGHSSTLRWNSDKLSFQVKFKFPYGPTELNYPVFADALFGAGAASQFDSLILDAMYNYAWHHANPVQRDYARFVTDQVVSDLQNLASGKGAPHGEYVHLYLNGLYWGLYNLHERPDDSFAAEYCGGDKDDYDVVKHANQDVAHEYTWVQGGVAAEQRFASLLSATQSVQDSPASAAAYAAVEQVLDVDQFIDYMIVHYYAGNAADWSHNNWYASRDRSGGLWRFHAWDQEHAFPTADNGDSYTQAVDLTGKDDFEAPTSIHRNLIGNAEYRQRFADRVQALMQNGGVLTTEAARSVYQARIDEITAPILGESARWGDNRNESDPYTQADFLAVNNAVIADFFAGRTQTVLSQFQTAGWLVPLAAPALSQYGGQVTPGYDLLLSLPAGAPVGAEVYYTLDGSDPRLAGGGANPLATHGPGPLTVAVNSPLRVLARVKNGADWSPLVEAAFTIPDLATVRVVELMYNPPGSGDATEYIELLNFGAATIDLAGLRLEGFSSGGYDFTGGSLGPGQRVVVVRDQAAFAAAYPGVANIAPGEFSGSLANEGETVALRGPVGGLLQSFVYGDSNAPGWPAAADGDGSSLEYIGPFDQDAADPSAAAGDPYDDPANWRASLAVGGTPGTDGSTVVPGDYDRNGLVEQLDRDFWAAQFGQTVTAYAGADGNGDGRVDAADYTVWRDNLGASPAIAAAIDLAMAANAGDAAVAAQREAVSPPPATAPLFSARAPEPAERPPAAGSALWRGPAGTHRTTLLTLALRRGLGERDAEAAGPHRRAPDHGSTERAAKRHAGLMDDALQGLFVELGEA